MSLKIEGHLTSKSSPLAPVSCKLTKQFIVQQHLNAHYKNISNVKSSIDNKCPKSWYKNVTVKDQLRKERLIKSARDHVRERNSPNMFQNKTFRSEAEDETVQTNNRMSYEDLRPIGPRIYKKDVKSKIAQLRCYNRPKIKNVVKTNSTVTLMTNTPSPETLKESPPPARKDAYRNEEEDLRYLNFCNDVTNDMLMNNVFTDRGIYQIFDYHIKRNVYNLKMDQMLIAYDNIRNELQGKQGSFKSDGKMYAENNISNDFTKNYPKIGENLVNRNEIFREESGNLNYENINPTKSAYGSNKHKEENESFNYNLNELREFKELDNDYDRNISNEKFLETKPYFKDYSTGDNSFSESLRKSSDENEDSKYLLLMKKEQNNIENEFISPKSKQIEFSTAPSALQWSLTSNEDHDLLSKFASQKPSPGEPSITEICEKIDNIQISELGSHSIEHNQREELENNSPEIENSNFSKNVHFANQNEIYSAVDNDDHSLTDVTSMRLEEGEESDDNNDSTCVESSLDLNNTFKSDGVKDNSKVIRYEDDFDD